MKKSVLYVFAVLLALSSCSSNDEFNNLDDSEFFEEYFEEWGISIPYQNVSNSKTYNLLEKLINHIDEKQIYLITYPANSLSYPSVTVFNEYLRDNKEATAFFTRGDCISVLKSTYLNDLKTERSLDYNIQIKFDILELLLASDIFMAKMNVTEKVQLMALALTRAKYEDYSHVYSLNIMISIMLSSNYTPFLNDVIIREVNMGACYQFQMKDGGAMMLNQEAIDFLIANAKQFINDNKK